MTQQEILEGNKLIARFSGYEYYSLPEDRSYNPGWWLKDKHKTINKITHAYLCRSHNDLRYYNSWDWLMPVVNKISEIHKDLHSDEKYEDLFESLLKLELNWNSFVYYNNDLRINSNIINNYLDVVNFIKWYNTNKL